MKKKWALISAAIAIICIITVAGITTFAQSLNEKPSSNPVVAYANFKHLPKDVVNILSPLGQNGSFDENTLQIINELADLGNYTDTPIVKSVLRSVVSSGTVDYNAVLRINDIDGDYIVNSLDPNPINPDTSGLGIGDFNLKYIYNVDPTNQTAVADLLVNIPNVSITCMGANDGNTPYTIQKVLDISIRDPTVKFYAEETTINWTNQNYGVLLVNGTSVNTDNDAESTISQPSYYLTHGRKGSFEDSTEAITSLLTLKGYNAKLVECFQPRHFEFTEVTINGTLYVVNANQVMPAYEFYESTGYVPTEYYTPS